MPFRSVRMIPTSAVSSVPAAPVAAVAPVAHLVSVARAGSRDPLAPDLETEQANLSCRSLSSQTSRPARVARRDRLIGPAPADRLARPARFAALAPLASLAFLACLAAVPLAAQDTVRFAQFNASMFRQVPGELNIELIAGSSAQIDRIAETIRTVDPDVLLINEFDYDPVNAVLFNEFYLGDAYPHVFSAPVNTGVASGLDLNGDGRIGGTGFAAANDAYGFGIFEGQYGMALFSKYPLVEDEIRTFREFLWSDMPDARRPETPDGTPFWDDATWSGVRLSSKSHWAVPVDLGATIVTVLAAHPTPPVFDGPEDRNGRRNADEIRLLADIARGADYLYDDRGETGGLAPGTSFVVMGDLNADPEDGDSLGSALDPLLDPDLVNLSAVPISDGAVIASRAQGEANARHRGDPAADTADFRDEAPGNLRVDYVLPSADLEIALASVFWPAPSSRGASLLSATDHRMVFVDLRIAGLDRATAAGTGAGAEAAAGADDPGAADADGTDGEPSRARPVAGSDSNIGITANGEEFDRPVIEFLEETDE